MLVQQLQYVVDDRVLRLGEEVRLREGRFRNAGSGILAAELSDDVVKVLLRVEALPFEDLHDSSYLPHVGDGGFFEGHAVACGALVAHGVTLSTSNVAAAARSLFVARKFPQTFPNTSWISRFPLLFV